MDIFQEMLQRHTREGNTNFTIGFENYTLTGDLDITAGDVTAITLNGSADPSITGDLKVTAGLATVTNNIIVGGDVIIVDVGNDSWIEKADGNKIILTDSDGASIVIEGKPEDITITVDAAGGISITVKSGAEVTSITTSTPIAIEVKAGATVTNIEASGGADGTTITNDGSVSNVVANVNIELANNSGAVTVVGNGNVNVSGTASGNVTIVTESVYNMTKMTEHTTLFAAVDGAAINDTILLASDIELSDTLTIDKSITLDLNGHNLTTSDSTGSMAKAVLKITGSSDVTIKGVGLIQSGTSKNSSGWASETISLQNVSSNLTIKDGVTVKGGDSINSKEASSAIWFWSSGTLTIENAQVVGGDQIKNSVDYASGYNNIGTAGDAINLEMGDNATVNIIAGSTVKGGKGINEGHGPILGDDEFKKATGGLAFSRHPRANINITDSTVLGGDSDLWDAESAIEMGAGDVSITNSIVKGGNGNKDGGHAIAIVGNSSGDLMITSSQLSGGDAGTSWLGCGIEYRKAINLDITGSTISGGGVNGSGTGYGNALLILNSVSTNNIAITDTTLELATDPEKVYGQVAISKVHSMDVYDMVGLLNSMVGVDNYTIENNGVKVVILPK